MDEEKKKKGSGNKNLLTVIVVGAICVGMGFFAGMKYQQSKLPQFARNLPGDFQGKMDRSGQTTAATGFRPVNGEIINLDDKSITVKLPDDSSKIILINDSSVINKTESSSIDDLKKGTNVTVFGQENSDGSITAQNIQIGTRLFGNPPDQNN
jgi:hypothetical protein